MLRHECNNKLSITFPISFALLGKPSSDTETLTQPSASRNQNSNRAGLESPMACTGGLGGPPKGGKRPKIQKTVNPFFALPSLWSVQKKKKKEKKNLKHFFFKTSFRFLCGPEILRSKNLCRDVFCGGNRFCAGFAEGGKNQYNT